jgi:BirA family transcriptional regulator, biotin operon repressor / biotin---[acetyl-CoA-carboxylase] ligase
MQLAMRVLDALATERSLESQGPRFVSGAALAARFAVTRSAVWKAVGLLREWGTPIEAVTNQGYRLALPASPLQADAVRSALDPDVAALLREGECMGSITSTNSVLLARDPPAPGHFDFLTAEHQSAGRGRRGRAWLAPPGGAICLSWSWSLAAMARHMGALSLVVGVAALRALRQHDIPGVGLKWPNDLVTSQGKLGGILIEMRSESAGPVHVVVGFGLNMALGQELRDQVRANGHIANDISSLTPSPPSRSALVAAVLNHGVTAIQEFARHGFAPLLEEYLAADTLRDRLVDLGGSAGPIQGIARGVDEDGALRVEHDGAIHRIMAGEVSVRTAP